LGMGGCGNEAATGQSDQEQGGGGGLVGELVEVSVLDSPDRSSVYFLRPADRSKDVTLLFDSKPELAPGTTIRVWGSPEGTDFRVSRYELVPPSASALINAPPQKAQTVAWVQIDINGGGVNQTKEAASALIFDQNGLRVATVDAGDRIVLKKVTISRDLGKEVEIGAGLTATDRVIASPPDGIAEAGDRADSERAEQRQDPEGDSGRSDDGDRCGGQMLIGPADSQDDNREDDRHEDAIARDARPPASGPGGQPSHGRAHEAGRAPQRGGPLRRQEFDERRAHDGIVRCGT